MEIFVRLLLITVKLVAIFLQSLQRFGRLFQRPNPNKSRLPPINNRILTFSALEMRMRLRSRVITAEALALSYIDRIKEVNPHLNAVVEGRFEAAMREACDIDRRIAAADDVKKLFETYPLLGLPVTVKESCSVAGMPLAVGSLARRHKRAEADGAVVARIRAAGAIPLLVSATPEFCYSIDTDTLLNGRCVNPYDFECVPGGSSGGEGALNAAGASLFGIGSDIGGSIRIPSLYCGIFGHKPTGGVVSVEGHFPYSSEAAFAQSLVLGPMTRFAGDLPLLLEIMAGDNASQLRLHEPVQLNEMKVHYAFGFDGLNGKMHLALNDDITLAMGKAVLHLRYVGVSVHHAKSPGFSNSLEIALSGIARLKRMPFVMEGRDQTMETIRQLLRSFVGSSNYTRTALIFDLMRRTNAFMSVDKLEVYRREALALTKSLTELLGENGVMFFPTSHGPSFNHGWSVVQLWGVDYTLLFNILGLPVTHVPMGVNKQGLPIGFSVIAAPHQDRLCLRIAMELERAFGGWVPPTPHKFPY